MSSELQPVFVRLRAILEAHSAGYLVSPGSLQHYGLEASVGPATLRAWGGKVKQPRIPVAWVTTGKAYVSYHLMGLASPKVRSLLSKPLAARMQGKTCFNFKTLDEPLSRELEVVTVRALAAFREAGFITPEESA